MTVPRILLVDDQRDVIRLLHSTLETLDHDLEVVEAPSGEEALLEASRGQIDLLVVDYRLPGITGLELIQKIRARHPDVKVVLVTGVTDKKAREAMSRAEADAFFVKPIPLGDFLDVVERHLGLAQTILPAESEAESAQRKTLSDLLASFRKKLGAQAIFLLSDRGRILIRAGELSDSSMEVSLLSALMAIYSAGQKVSRFIHQEASASLHLFKGGDHDLVLMPVNVAHALLVAGDQILARDKVSAAQDTLLMLQSEVEKVLRAIGVVPQPMAEGPAPAKPPTRETADEQAPTDELGSLLDQSKKKKLKPDEIESFWDEAAGKQGTVLTNPDVISYEQARRLGLAPEQEEK